MELRCPDCASPEVALIDRRSRLECGNCGSSFAREQAFVTLADAEAYPEQRASCSCEELRGCPRCFERAEELVGATVRDSLWRQWKVTEVGEKDGLPTICGTHYWDRPEQVEVLRPPPHQAASSPGRDRRTEGSGA